MFLGATTYGDVVFRVGATLITWVVRITSNDANV